MTKHSTDVRMFVRLLALALSALAGCHGSHSGTVGSESHFLEACSSDDECGELSCIDGLCTSSCTGNRECSSLAEGGRCMARTDAPSTRASEQICNIACTRDATCAAIGAGLRCESGRCSAQAESSGTAGSGGVVAGPTAGSGTTDPSPAVPNDPGAVAPPGGGQPLDPATIGGGNDCSQTTPFPGDSACLPPPAAGEGIQIHIGPRSYDDEQELLQWLVQPGADSARCWSFQLPNTADMAFAEWELSMRPGIHSSVHLLDRSAGAFDICLLPESPVWTTIPDLIVGARVRMPREAAAAENAAIGRRIPAHAAASSFAHVFNFTDAPTVIELWLNVYTPRATPVEYDVPLRAGPGSTLVLEPSTGDLASFSCPIAARGRLLSLGALILPSTRNLEVTLQRASGESIALLRRISVSESSPHLVPALRYDSVSTNPAAGNGTPLSGFSGPVELEPGDVLNWSCLLEPNSPAPNLCDLAGSATIALDCQ